MENTWLYSDQSFFVFRNIIEQVADHVMVTDKHGFIEYVNPAFEKTTGYSKEEVLGKNPKILQSGKQSLEYYQELWRTILAGRSFCARIINKKKNGGFYVADQTISPVFNRSKEITHFVSIWKDVTEIVRIEEQLITDYKKIRSLNLEIEIKNKKLEHLDKLKDEFINGVSHELRTPLTIIKESIALIHDQTVGSINPKQKDFLETAKDSVDRLLRLINDILDYQKIESQKMKFNMAEGSVNDTVKEVGEGFNTLLEHKGISLEFQLQAGLPHIKFDHDKIIQVLTNLIDNAIKFTKKGKICLMTQKDGENSIRVSIKDEGIGIKEEDLHKLFRTFSQISIDQGHKGEGTGLGLVLCKKIIENHKGRVGVISEFGRGSTFYFVLPIQERRDNS